MRNRRFCYLIACVLLCACVFGYLPARAYPFPRNAVFFDVKQHNYEGVVCWTTDIEYKGNPFYTQRQLCAMDLNSGEISRFNVDNNVYLVYADGEYPGVLLAREEAGGGVGIYNMRNFNEWKQLFFYLLEGEDFLRNTSNLFGYPCTVLAYMRGYLYYVLINCDESGNEQTLTLRRDDMNGGIYDYSCRYMSGYCPNPAGALAWKDSENNKLMFESPEKGVFEAVIRDELGAKFSIIGWLSDTRLLYRALRGEEYLVMYYDIDTQAYGAYIDNDGNEIIAVKPYICYNSQKDGVFVGIDFIAEGIWYGAITLFDVNNGNLFSLHDSIIGNEYKEMTTVGNRAVWAND